MSGPDVDGTGDASTERHVPWEVIESTIHWEGYSTVRVDRVAMPDGDVAEREVVEHMAAACVVAMTADREVVLVRQYRHALGRFVLEVPAGGVDPVEEPEDAAVRELAEEVGLRPGRIDHLARFHNSVGWSTECTDIYLARELAEAPPPEDFHAVHEEAHMEVVRLPLDAAIDAVHDGTITDSKTIIALLRTQAFLAI